MSIRHQTKLSDATFKAEVKKRTIQNILNDFNDLDFKPPYQREECWEDKRKIALIKSIINDIPVGVVHLVEKTDGIGYYILDGKQRTLAISQFVKNEFKIPVVISENDAKVEVIDDRTVKVKKLTYDQMLNHTNLHVKKLAKTFVNYNFDIVLWPSMEISDQRKLFVQINFSKPLSNNEKIYCPYFLAKNLFEYIIENTAYSQITTLMRKQAKENSRCYSTKLIHDICILCFGIELSKNSYLPVDLGIDRVKKSAETIHNLCVRTNVVDSEKFSEDALKSINFDEKFKVLKNAFSVLNLCLSSNNVAYREIREDGEIDNTYIKDVVTFMVKKHQENELDLSNTANVSGDDIERLRTVCSEYIEAKYKISQSAKYKSTTESWIKERMALLETLWVNSNLVVGSN